MSPEDEEGLDALADDLYREHLLDHYTNPRNHGLLDPADLRLEGDNPSCGDRLAVTARLAGNRLAEIGFEGTGCAISQAAASILFEEVRGKTVQEVLAMTRQTVEDLIGLTLRPARVKCGVLGLNTLKHAIGQHQGRTQGATARPPGFGPRREPGT